MGKDGDQLDESIPKVAAVPPWSRALVFLLYDADGICDESTLHTLRGFRPHVDLLLVVSNGALEPQSRAAVSAIADVVLERDNVGFDVGAYRDAFAHIGWDRLADFDEVLMVNYTFFGPVGSFEPVLERMRDTAVDFWGITDHPEVSPHPYLGKGTMPRHLQSFWLGVRKSILTSNSFRNYWLSLSDPKTYSDVVVFFETGFTSYFAELGFTWQAAYPAADYGVVNSTMEAPLALLRDDCPLFKKRLYFHDAPWLAKHGVFSGAVTAEAVRRGYPADLVVAGAHRRATVRELSFGMDATFIVPSLPEEPSPGKNYVVVQGSPWKRLVEEGLDTVMGDAELLIVDAAAPQRGNLADGNTSAYRYAHDAVVEGAWFIERLFVEQPNMAAVFPYTNLLSEPVQGRKWFARTEAARGVAEALGLSGPFNHASLLAPFRGIGAYRQSLVRAIGARVQAAGGWGAVVAVSGSEEALLRILDLLAADVAKDQGWYVGQVATPEEARRSASLLQDTYSRGPFVQPEYLDYPYAGRVIVPSIKNRVGRAVKNSSPAAFETLHSVEKQLRNLLRGSGGQK